MATHRTKPQRIKEVTAVQIRASLTHGSDLTAGDYIVTESTGEQYVMPQAEAIQEMQEVAGERHSKTPNLVRQDPRFDQDPKMLTDLTARNPDIEPKPEFVADPKLETDEMIRRPMTGQTLRDGAEAHGFQGDPKLLTDAERRGMDPDTGEKPKGGKPKSAGQRVNRKGK